MKTIATFTKRLLDRQHWSFREQERHTNVRAHVVYDLTLENTVQTTELLKLTVAAKYLIQHEEDRRFWCTVERQLRKVNCPTQLTPEAQGCLNHCVTQILMVETNCPVVNCPPGQWSGQDGSFREGMTTHNHHELFPSYSR